MIGHSYKPVVSNVGGQREEIVSSYKFWLWVWVKIYLYWLDAFHAVFWSTIKQVKDLWLSVKLSEVTDGWKLSYLLFTDYMSRKRGKTGLENAGKKLGTQMQLNVI